MDTLVSTKMLGTEGHMDRIQLRWSNFSMILPTYPGKVPQTSPVFPQGSAKKEIPKQKLLVKGQGYFLGGHVGEILELSNKKIKNL